MATTVAYAASMCTRKTNSSSNAKNGVACQEFYDSSYNYVGIVCFSGMNLANKVITGIWLSIDAARAGYGAGSTKTVYMRKANYQNSIASGVTGSNYAGAALGTFDGSFFGNSTVYQMTGTLFNNMAAYISQGNNTFTIYNPSPGASSQGYSYNYLQWTAVTITITYEEAVSQPSTSASSVNMGSAVTVYTNRVSSSTTHTLLYTFGNASGTIATNVGASVSWTPPLTLAAQIPSATNGVCTITCQSYNGGTLTGTRTCTLTLNVPVTVVPSISSVTVEDTNSTVATRIQAYVRMLSTLSVAITAAGTYGSTVSSYRTSLDGVTYTTASFTASKKLSTAGDVTLTVTVTDTRGRTATYTETLTVLDYSYPSIRLFKADRCNSDGSAAQVDGTNVRYSFEGGVIPLNNKNALACVVYFKLASADTWTQAETLPVSSYNLSQTDKVLTQTFDALASYPLPAGKNGLNCEEQKKRQSDRRTSVRIGSQYNLNLSTVESYGRFSRSLDQIERKSPGLLTNVLAGSIRMSKDTVDLLADMPAEEIGHINRALNDHLDHNHHMTVYDTNRVIEKIQARERKVPNEPVIIPEIKKMPAYDPDAGVNGLLLTVPTWISTIKRITEQTDFALVSDAAKDKLARTLRELESAASGLQHKTGGCEHGH